MRSRAWESRMCPKVAGIFPNLSVRENLVMAARAGAAGRRDWTFERVMQTFPRLAERLAHGGAQLSGGEQQMLTIGRALMTNPRPADPGRSDRRPGAENLARDLGYHRPDQAGRNRGGDRGQELRRGIRRRRPRGDPGERRDGVRRRERRTARAARTAPALPGCVADAGHRLDRQPASAARARCSVREE